MTRLQPALACGALLLAFIFIFEGVPRSRATTVVDYMQAHGVSGRLLPFVILTEILGGALIAVGLTTRCTAVAMAGFVLLTAYFFHRDFSDEEQLINFNKNLAIAGGFLALAAFGAGAWSLDALVKLRQGLSIEKT